MTRTDYERFCRILGVQGDAQVSPAERAGTLPSWFGDALVRTAAARRKLHAWATRTPRATWEAQADAATVLVSLHAFGDPVVPHTVAQTLCRLPAPVRAYAAESVTWLGIGVGFAGWCGPRPEFGDRPWLVALSAHQELETLIAHETAHAWLLEEPHPNDRLLPAFADWTIRDTGLSRVPEAAMDAVVAARRQYARDEDQVHALLRAWGFAHASLF